MFPPGHDMDAITKYFSDNNQFLVGVEKGLVVAQILFTAVEVLLLTGDILDILTKSKQCSTVPQVMVEHITYTDQSSREYEHEAISPSTSGAISSTAYSPAYSSEFSLQSPNFAKDSKCNPHPFRSRIVVEPVEKYWLDQKPKRQEVLATWIFRSSWLCGLMVLVGFTYSGWTSWETNKFCLVLEDNFDTFDSSIWTREVESGGFGTGEFEWTTPYEDNSYVKDNKLYLVPTISAWPQQDMTTLNLTDLGICTVDVGHSGRTIQDNCVATRNSTADTYLPPVQSARISTRFSHAIKYGRVEVRAKMPVGDWIWPAIWMLPSDNVYGLWPQSGEIDIAESRGNADSFVSVDSLGGLSKGGHNTVISTLHWGSGSPYTIDQSGLTTNGLTFPSGSTSLTEEFHTFGMEWTKNSIRTYVDKKLTRIAYFKTPASGFWTFGRFSTITQSKGYSFTNPWIGAALDAPFNQEFYLIINLAVGGLGYFNTINGLLPWNINAGRDDAIAGFMNAQGSWNQTWGTPEQRGLIIDSVKMWKLCN